MKFIKALAVSLLFGAIAPAAQAGCVDNFFPCATCSCFQITNCFDANGNCYQQTFYWCNGDVTVWPGGGSGGSGGGQQDPPQVPKPPKDV